MKPVAVFDTECYINYWLCKFLNPTTGGFAEYELYKDHPLDVGGLRKVLDRYTVIGFNSKDYDMPLITAALGGASNEQLKAMTADVIDNRLKSWQTEQQYGITIPEFDHIDLIEVAPGVMDSLKIYGGRLHTKKMQELPYPIDTILTREQMAKVNEYCGNDLRVTAEVFVALKKQLEVRARLSKEHGMDLRSKSDPQIAEAIICAELEKLNDAPVKRPPKGKPKPFRYDPPSFIKFKTEKLQRLFENVCSSEFSIHTSPKGKDSIIGLHPDASVPISIRGKTYQFGIGGLHSQESNKCYRSGLDAALYEIDATSFYPSAILNCKLFPPHLGEGFLVVFGKIVHNRITAKAALQEAEDRLDYGEPNEADADELRKLISDLTELTDGGKIQINGTFGKTNSKFSKLYSPKMMLTTTITGQLAELMLIERLELACIDAVSANTDGIVVYCAHDKRQRMQEIVKEWERDTGFNMEESRYLAMYSRDVNNYIAIKQNGKVKLKGVFAETGLSHNPQNQICYQAVVAYVKDGVPVEDTINKCRDIRQFVTVRKVNNGGAEKDGVYIGGAIRWYHSTATNTPITYVSNGNMVPETTNSMPCMELPDSFPEDVDIPWYIAKAQDIIHTPGYRNQNKMPSGIGIDPQEIYWKCYFNEEDVPS